LKAAAAHSSQSASPLQSSITALRTVGARLPGLRPDEGWSVLGRGFKSTYRRARKAHAAAHAERSTAAMHAWRRRSKDFEHQLQLLRKIDPSVMKPRIREARLLTELLGDDHDLAVLERTLAAVRDLPAELREKLNSRIASRRKKKQRKAFKLGSDLFFEKPSVVVKEVGQLWKRWRRG
jgi:CHAD domain-containing protein